MKRAWLIARAELRLFSRDRVALTVSAVAGLILTVATVVAADRAQQVREARTHYQSLVNRQFEAQPNRHPHRVVHYGTFAFRQPGLLAGFDPGIESFVGHMVYLEGHRQNTANFGEARKSSMLLRFGELSPAFVLQVLWPLLLVFLGFGAMARERERGYLVPLLAQGVSIRSLIAGKWLALSIIALLLAAPALVLLWIIGSTVDLMTVTALSFSAYVIYLLTWAGAIVLVSALSRSARNALFGCLAAWTATVIVIPRALTEVASLVVMLPTRVETDIRIHHELAAMGDSHNPDDPYFKTFRAKVLAQYGVSRIEELPVNYAGVLGVEGERMTSRLFDEHSVGTFALLEKQNRLVETFGVLSPVVSLRCLSMTAAGSGWSAYRDFLEQAERYRFELVQALNTLQAVKLSYADDIDESKENRIDAAYLRALQEFHWISPDPGRVAASLITPLFTLLAWAVAILGALLIASRRMGVR